jgi:DNA-binding SARP family transcriptional activator
VLHVSLFGSLRLVTGDHFLGPRDLGGLKPKQVLEILLLNRGRTVSKDRLADLLWGEALPQSSTGTLETYVSVLRRRMSTDRHQGRAFITTEPGGYRFAVESADLDLDRFDGHTTQASLTTGRERRRHLESAAALLRGPLVEDSPFEPWALAARRQYDAVAVEVLSELALATLVDREFDAALGWSERAVASDPHVERPYRLMMLSAYGLHGRTKALSVFERCREMCRDEIGVEVSPQTAALRESILGLSPVEALVDTERREFLLRISREQHHSDRGRTAARAPTPWPSERDVPDSRVTVSSRSPANQGSMQLYETDPDLVSSVAEGIANATTAGDAVLLVATEGHRTAIEAAVSLAWPELNLASYRALDAEATLQSVLVAGHPDRDRFRNVVGSAVAELVTTGQRVFVFGEMMGLLWTRGEPVAAIELAGLWSELSRELPFFVLCGYGSTAGDATALGALGSVRRTFSAPER